MGIQINGSTDRITAIDGTIDFVSNIGNIGLITASRYELQDSITIGAGSTIIKTVNGKLLIGRASGSFAIDAQTGSDSTFRISNSGESSHGSHDAKIVAGGSYYQNPNIVGSTIKFSTYNGSAEGERVRIDSAGRVGIGEDAPQQKLHLHEASSNGNFMVFTNSTTGATGSDGCLFGINSDEAGTIWQQENNYIRFGTNDTERLRITSDGKLGLGETSPDQILHIRHATHPYIRTTLNDATVNANNVFGAWEFESLDISTNCAGVVGKIDCIANATFDGTSANGADIRFLTSATNPISLTERLRIASNGKVSIHTAPYSGGGTVPELYVRGGSGRTLKIHNPNVGTSCIQLTNQTTGEGEDTGFFIQQLGSGDAMFTHIPSNKDIIFRTSDGGTIGERVRISSNGRLSFAGDTDTYIHHPAANQLAITRSGGSFPLIRFGTGGQGGTVGFSTDTNLVTGGEIISVRGYSTFKSGNKDYAAIYTHNEGNTSGTYNAHILWNAGGANRGGIGYMPNNGEVIINNQNALIFATGSTHLNGTQRLKIASDGVAHFAGDVKVLTGDIQMGNGRGINFSPTSDGPTMGSETFDDYEEGTYTPSISNLGNHTTHSDTYGAYTKVGNLVTVRFFYKWTNRSTTNGAYNVLLSIPFTSSSTNRGHGSCGVEGCQPHSSDRTSYHTSVPTSSTNMQFRCSGANNSENSFNGSISTSLSSGYFMGVVSYESA